MKPTEASVKQIVSPDGTIFSIPIWQRVYSWDKKEWGDLWEDTLILYNSLIENKQAEHFIGAIVTCSEENMNIPFAILEY